MNLCCLKLTSVIPSASYGISHHKVEYGVSLAFMLGTHCLQSLVFQSILVFQPWSALLHCEGFSIRDKVPLWAQRDFELQRGNATSLTQNQEHLDCGSQSLPWLSPVAASPSLHIKHFLTELIIQETTSSLFGIHLGSIQSFKALTYNRCKTGW